MKSTFDILLAAVVLIMGTPLALAQTHMQNAAPDTKTATSTSVAVPSNQIPWISNFTFSYLSFLSGPPVTDMRSQETAAARDGYTLGLSVQNQIGIRYNVTDSFSIMPVFDFEYDFTDPHNGGQNLGINLDYDSYIRAKYLDVLATSVDGNKISMDAELRYYVPDSDFSRQNGSYGSVRAGVIPGVDFNSGVSVSMLAFMRYWMQSRYYEVPSRFNFVVPNTIGLPEFTFYLGPQISYRTSDTFNFWFLYEASKTIDTLGYDTSTDPERSNADIEPGFDINLGRGVVVSPYLNWYTNQPLNTTSVNLITSISI